MERLRRILQGKGLYIGWYFLDDFATWFGQKEEKIADIMAIAPCIKNDERMLKLAISEAKIRSHQKDTKPIKGNRHDSLPKLSIASVVLLNPKRNRIDKDVWLHRIGDLMIENMEPSDDLPVGNWSLHKWSEEGKVRGVFLLLSLVFSHVFCARRRKLELMQVLVPIRGFQNCQQIVLDCSGGQGRDRHICRKTATAPIFPRRPKKLGTIFFLFTKAHEREGRLLIEKQKLEDGITPLESQSVRGC